MRSPNLSSIVRRTSVLCCVDRTYVPTSNGFWLPLNNSANTCSFTATVPRVVGVGVPGGCRTEGPDLGAGEGGRA